jgi:mRNA interferase RelE/StbE
MAHFTIRTKPSVQKDIKDIPNKIAKTIFMKILALQEDPFPADVKKLQGMENTYRIRSGDYRIVYEVLPKESLIVILHIRHRKDIYDNL